MSEKKSGTVYCLAATMVVLLVVAVGAFFLIAPVWQPGYHAIGYHLTLTEDAADANSKMGEEAPPIAEPIELNTATEQQLMQLSGIGEGRATAIVAYRQQNGGFSDVEELAKIPGISQKMVDSWAEQIYIAKSEK